RTQRHAAGHREQAQFADAAHLRRSGLSREIPCTQFHLFDRELAGGVRRAHSPRVGEMGQGHPRRKYKGGVTIPAAAGISRSRLAPLAALAIQSLRFSFASARRFMSSRGSSSLSTSRNEKARIGLRVPRGWSVRNASRIAPSSKVRRTAISV